jgi:hypothetical protein
LKPIRDLDARVRKAIRGVDVDRRPKAEDQTTKVRLFDKLRALELLGKYLNLFEEGRLPEPPTQVNIGQVIQNIREMSTEELLRSTEKKLRETREANLTSNTDSQKLG